MQYKQSSFCFAVLAGNFLYTRLTWWFQNEQFKTKNTIQSNSPMQQEHQQEKCFGICFACKTYANVCVYTLA